MYEECGTIQIISNDFIQYIHTTMHAESQLLYKMKAWNCIQIPWWLMDKY
jgi:hypothetical protein